MTRERRTLSVGEKAVYFTILAITVPMIVVVMALPQPRYIDDGAQYLAPAYEWPAGCPPHDYGPQQKLPMACHVAPYIIIDNARSLGLLRVYKGYHWVRVGNNALWVSCNTHRFCRIFSRAPNRFTQDPTKARHAP